MMLAEPISIPDQVRGAVANGINRDGDVVGVARTADGELVGFHRSSQGVFRLIEASGATATFLQDISDDGTIVGDCEAASGEFEGVVIRGGTIGTFSAPKSRGTFLTAISNDGLAVGAADDKEGFRRAVLLDLRGGGAAFSDLRIGDYASDSLFVSGIGVDGTLVGSLRTPADQWVGFVERDGEIRLLPGDGAARVEPLGTLPDGETIFGRSTTPANPEGANEEGWIFHSERDGYQRLTYQNHLPLIPTGCNADGVTVGYAVHGSYRKEPMIISF